MMQNGLPPISEHLPDFKKACVFIVGDLMLDRYWYGDASRISPEAPVPVVRVGEMQARPGGAANVALNIASLGGHVALMGLVGVDEEAKELQAFLSAKNIDCQFQAVPGYPTITKLRVLGQNQQLLRLDFEQQLEHYDDRDIIDRY